MSLKYFIQVDKSKGEEPIVHFTDFKEAFLEEVDILITYLLTEITELRSQMVCQYEDSD